MQRANMPNTDSPEEYGKIIAGPKPRDYDPMAASRMSAPQEERLGAGPAMAPRTSAPRSVPQRSRARLEARNQNARQSRVRMLGRGGQTEGAWNAVAWGNTFAILWALAGIGLVAILAINGQLGSQSLGDWLMLFLAFAVPLAILWLIVLVLRHSSDLHRAALAMGRTANQLMEPDQSAADDVKGLGHAIRGELDNVTVSLDKAMRRVGMMEELLQSQTQSLEEAAERLDARTKAIDATLDAQQKRIESLAQALATEAKGVGEAIDEKVSILKDASERANDQLRSTQASFDERTRALDTVAAQAVRQAHQASQDLEAKTRGLDEVSAKAFEMAGTVGSKYAAQQQELASTLARMSEHNDALETRIQGQRESLDRIADMIRVQTKHVDDVVTQCLEDLNKTVATVRDSSTLMAQDFTDRIERIGQAGETAATAIAKASEMARTASEVAKTELETQGTTIREKLSEQIITAKEALGELGEETRLAMLRHAEASRTDVSDSVERLRSILDNHVGDARQSLEGLHQDLSKAVNDGSEGMAERLLAVLDRINRARDDLGTSLRAAGDHLSGELDKLRVDLDAGVRTAGQGLGEQIKTLRFDLDASVKAARDQLTGHVEETRQQVAASSAAMEQAAKAARGHMDDASAKASGALGRLQSESSQTLKALNEATETLSGYLAKLPDEASGSAAKIRELMEDQVRQIRHITEDAVGKARALNQILSGETDGLNPAGARADMRQAAPPARTAQNGPAQVPQAQPPAGGAPMSAPQGHAGQAAPARGPAPAAPRDVSRDAGRPTGSAPPQTTFGGEPQTPSQIPSQTPPQPQAEPQNRQDWAGAAQDAGTSGWATSLDAGASGGPAGEAPRRGLDAETDDSVAYARRLVISGTTNKRQSPASPPPTSQPPVSPAPSSLSSGPASQAPSGQGQGQGQVQRPGAPDASDRTPAPSGPFSQGSAPQGMREREPRPLRADQPLPRSDRIEDDSRGRRRDNEDAKAVGWRTILEQAERAERDTAEKPRTKAAPSEASRVSLRVVESLQSMAIDLDRALEEDPPADLLQRYLNGDRNAFARRLVSLGGPDFSEKIRRKYGQEMEFRQEVNRYISEFENLLDTISSNDRENILAETYLTSQTGKVYMLLKSAIEKKR